MGHNGWVQVPRVPTPNLLVPGALDAKKCGCSLAQAYPRAEPAFPLSLAAQSQFFLCNPLPALPPTQPRPRPNPRERETETPFSSPHPKPRPFFAFNHPTIYPYPTLSKCINFHSVNPWQTFFSGHRRAHLEFFFFLSLTVLTCLLPRQPSFLVYSGSNLSPHKGDDLHHHHDYHHHHHLLADRILTT